MGSFLIRLIVALGISAGILFLITGGQPTKLPEVSEEGFKMEFGDSYSVEGVRDKVKDFFSGKSTSTVIDLRNDSNSTSTEADVEFFKKILPQSESKDTDQVKDDELQEQPGEDKEESFIEKIANQIKNQLNKVSSNEETKNALSVKEDSVPSFTTACFPETKQVCSRDRCLKESPKAEFTLLDRGKSLIAHCDSEGCVTYNAEYEEVDGYENYQPVTPKGYIINKEKDVSENGRSEYVEVVTGGVKTTMYSGYCINRE
ncbi:MAG TPA: hypothetical protein VKO61_00845 [Candidatus Paceibacterota bacterium]|nr:hypothetical protein [Candidatus Paceibacterota bacterium]